MATVIYHPCTVILPQLGFDMKDNTNCQNPLKKKYCLKQKYILSRQVYACIFELIKMTIIFKLSLMKILTGSRIIKLTFYIL